MNPNDMLAKMFAAQGGAAPQGAGMVPTGAPTPSVPQGPPPPPPVRKKRSKMRGRAK
jgi:hypothetical protein